MKHKVVAERYAEALFELAHEMDKVAEFGEALEGIAELLGNPELPDFKRVLEHPVIKHQDKKDLLSQVFKDKVPDAMLNFLFLLVDKKRENYLLEINAEYQRLLNALNQTVIAEVVTAVPMYKKTQTILQQQLESYLNQKVVMNCDTNPDLLGGVTIKIGDRMIDGSLKTQLAEMAQTLV